MRRLSQGLWVVVWFFLAARGGAANGADYDEARRQFIAGSYAKCLAQCEQALRNADAGENWRILRARCLITVGRYPEAQKGIEEALDRHAASLRVRWAGYEVLRECGQTAQADSLINDILSIANASPQDFRDPGSLVAIGQAAMLRGADPKQVLDKLFELAKKREPTFRDAYLAAGNLALSKNDYELAATQFQEGLQRFAQDADFYYGLARAFAPSDSGQATTNLQKALEFNPNHVPALLLVVNHLIDAEDYTEAVRQLEKINTINPWHPEAWAYRAVLARLKNDGPGHLDARDRALKYWKTNPAVDALIGQKLSRKYRFAEGATFQRRALKVDPRYLPAKIQLAQDLLRLGEEKEGWQLAEEVFQSDAYDVVAYNLTTLKDSLSKFQVVSNQDFVVRMSAREAALYGERALELLNRAKRAIGEKYGVKVQTPIYVEIFPESKDFAVRTFALPAESGYLGVCFGRVITANSPATQTATPANWESMLWHEYTHVVTLQMTGNKIPRWLSEGLSVYEERQASPGWGQRLSPSLREGILGGELKKIENLSAAFLNPKKPTDVQFAYYQSSLVVEYFMKRFGLERVKALLEQLNGGAELKAALESQLAPLAQLEREFAEYARDYARRMGPGLDWTKPPRRFGQAKIQTDDILETMRQQTDILSTGATSMEEWIRKNPTNYWALKEQARARMAAKEWAKAQEPLRLLIELNPADAGADSAYAGLAATCRHLNQTNEEQAALSRLAALDDTAVDAYARLMELAARKQDWAEVLTNVSRYLAVNPLVPPPYRYLAMAAEGLGQDTHAIRAYRMLLLLDPPDPADVHYRLGRLLARGNDPEAKRQVLMALEEAPRFREAHHLLRDIRAAAERPKTPPASGVEPAPVSVEPPAGHTSPPDEPVEVESKVPNERPS